jgi:hypothetical protein
MLFEWDDDIGNIPKQPIDSVRPDDQITGGDIAMAVCVFPIYCYFVVPSIISDVFFFPDKTTLKINDKEYKELGPMSYVNVVGGLTLIYYDTATETSEVIELNDDVVTVVNSNINVNVSERYFTSFGNKVLLFTPTNLKPVFKTIDK